MTRVNTILFDAGFTLVRIQPSLGEVYARVADDLGSPFPAERFHEVGLRVWNQAKLPWYRNHLESSDAIERRFWWDYNRLIVRELEAEGLDVNFEAWFDALFEVFARPETWCPLPGAHETLTELRERGFNLGVVSNWDSRLPGVLEGLDLARHFTLVLTSADAGYRKPSPHIFAQALDRLEADPAASMHVGDSEEDDVQGALASGIRPVWLRAGTRDRPAVPPSATTSASHVITRLTELLDLLDRPAP
jgi:putative hydrolase of the HAD superfamily